MKIRTKLTLIFTVIVASIMIVFSVAVYYFSSIYRENEFYGSLKNKALSTARLLIEVNEVDTHLMKIIDQTRLNSLHRERIRIFNYLNNTIYDSDETIQTPPVTRDLLNQIRLQKEIRFKEGDREKIGFTFNYKYDRFVVIASAFDKSGIEKLHNLRIILSIGLIISSIVVMAGGWVYAGRSISPIADVIRQVEQITVSNLNLRVKEGNGKDEIAQLAITFNQMLDRLQAAFEIQRSFVANASHELRTPLTIITGHIEVTLIRQRNIEEYQELLRSVLDDIKNLNKLSNGLLDLAQVSLDVANIKLQEVQVEDIVYQAIEAVYEKNPTYNILFEMEEQADARQREYNIPGEESLLKTAFINLVENACKFSESHHVKVRWRIEGRFIVIDFTDQGMGIPARDLPFIFQPFFRAENTKHIKGHGIGLPLTERIVQLHKGTISVASVEGVGSVFTVRLPFLMGD